uniref:Thioredoxin domain-containing protein 17 n=1 Tax=Leptobrachium leishanense TaxID=445787 RepID=A0A8C5LXT5_9ANUR
MAAYTEVKVQGYEEYCREADKRKGAPLYAFFCGNKNERGVSWCPDCVKAEPVVRGELKHLPDGAVFIYCSVGERDYWKDPNNEFKQNLKLTGVPTLTKCGTTQKLVEEQCLNADLVQMLFTED